MLSSVFCGKFRSWVDGRLSGDHGVPSGMPVIHPQSTDGISQLPNATLGSYRTAPCLGQLVVSASPMIRVPVCQNCEGPEIGS
jgi:hypothetical protein